MAQSFRPTDNNKSNGDCVMKCGAMTFIFRSRSRDWVKTNIYKNGNRNVLRGFRRTIIIRFFCNNQ